ncbi:hypothetical protein M3J09_003705 [Ascochyta lentis]
MCAFSRDRTNHCTATLQNSSSTGLNESSEDLGQSRSRAQPRSWVLRTLARDHYQLPTS